MYIIGHKCGFVRTHVCLKVLLKTKLKLKDKYPMVIKITEIK